MHGVCVLACVCGGTCVCWVELKEGHFKRLKRRKGGGGGGERVKSNCQKFIEWLLCIRK